MAQLEIDPCEIARTELAQAMVPTPDDIVGDLSPLACLYFLEQLGWAVLTCWTAYASDEADKGSESADDLAETLNAIAMTVGQLDQTCARIGLLPVEAVPPQ